MNRSDLGAVYHSLIRRGGTEDVEKRGVRSIRRWSSTFQLASSQNDILSNELVGSALPF